MRDAHIEGRSCLKRHETSDQLGLGKPCCRTRATSLHADLRVVQTEGRTIQNTFLFERVARYVISENDGGLEKPGCLKSEPLFVGDEEGLEGF